MPPRHVDDLFSAAYDDALTERQRRFFTEHLQECSQCRSAYEQFHLSVDTLRSLPPARMPIPVHLPSTAPVAEQRPLARLRLPWTPRFRPGMATGVAALAAAVLVAVAVTHQSSTNQIPALSQAGGGGSAALQAPESTSQCPSPASAAAADIPGGFDHRNVATDAARPGQQLVLATTSTQVAPGSQVPVYAVLTAPLAAAAAPAASAGRPASIAAVPCVSIGPLVAAGSADGAVPNSVPVLGTAAGAAGASGALRYASPPLLYFTVPPGTPAGTKLHITATVPAGYPRAGDPAMTVDLTITVG